MPPSRRSHGRNATRSQCLFAPLQTRVRPRARETPIPEFGFARIITTRTRNFSIFKSHYRIAALRLRGSTPTSSAPIKKHLRKTASPRSHTPPPRQAKSTTCEKISEKSCNHRGVASYLP